MTLMVLLTLVAATLAVIGVYGVMAYLVSQGTRDMGIRLALGASPASILRLILSKGVMLGVVGVVLGLAGAAGLTRLMTSVLFGVAPIDALTFASVALLLLAVVLAACLIPARRAAGTNPTVALRSE